MLTSLKTWQEVEHRDIFPLPLLMIGGKYDEFEVYQGTDFKSN